MTESFAELFEQSLTDKQMQPGAIVQGTVVEIRADTVVVNAGLKSEGLIPLEQFYNEEGVLEVQVGDQIEVALDALEDGFGETRLSREKAKRARIWTALEKAFEGEEIVKGLISGKVKGGFTWTLAKFARFCPVPWWTCDRCETPPTWKARSRNSRSSSSTVGATMWWCPAGQ
jgi:small subunit ribosomal protein S1